MDNVLLALFVATAVLAYISVLREQNLRRTELKEALLCIDDLQARVKALEEKE